MLRAITKWILAWLAAGVITALLGSIFSSLRVIALLENIDGNSGLGQALSMMSYDAVHFGTLYFIFVALGFLIAFLAGNALLWAAKLRRRAAYRYIVFSVAAAVSMSVMLWAMKNVFFGTQIVAGARGATGFLLQVLAGIIGGLVFAFLSQSRPPKSD